MIVLDAGPGVHAVLHGHTTCFLVENDDGVTLVDAAYPADMANAPLLVSGRWSAARR